MDKSYLLGKHLYIFSSSYSTEKVLVNKEIKNYLYFYDIKNKIWNFEELNYKLK